jgi:hypothetical protein
VRTSSVVAEPPRDSSGTPVFASPDGRRARALRRAGMIAAALATLWLVALVAGAIGIGRLPGLAFPRVGAAAVPHRPASAPASRHRATGPAAPVLPGGAAPSRVPATRAPGAHHGAGPAIPPTDHAGTDAKPVRPHGSLAAPAIPAPGAAASGTTSTPTPSSSAKSGAQARGTVHRPATRPAPRGHATSSRAGRTATTPATAPSPRAHAPAAWAAHAP